MTDSDTPTRAQFITLGAFVLLILLIGGVQVAYSGVDSYDKRQSGVSQQQSVEEPVEELADGLTTTMADINHAPSISTNNQETELKEAFSAHNQSRNPREVGVFTDINNIYYVDGTRIVQTDPTANFTADGGQSDWDAFDDGGGVKDTRQFVVSFHDLLNMPNESQPHPTFDLTTTSTTKTVEVYIPTTGSNTGDMVVEVGGDKCAVTPDLNQGVTSVDMLRGNVDGTPCPNLGISDAVTDVRFENAGTATGTFSLTYWGDPSDRDSGAIPTEQNTPPAYGSKANPIAHDVVYAAVVDITALKSGSGTTQTAIIAPGDIHTQLD